MIVLTQSSPIRYFPYYISVSALTILFIIGLFWLIAERRLLPAIVMIGAFMLFVLWLTGLVVISIELFGPSGSISSNCDIDVFTRDPRGQTQEALAYLQQRNICRWHAFLILPKNARSSTGD